MVPAQSITRENVPDKPFMTTHLLRVSALGEKTFLASVVDMNAAIAKGCEPCVYHVWKFVGQQVGVYNYFMNSSWPGRDVYVKVHESAEFKAASTKHPEADIFFHAQVYNRYVEVPLTK